MNDDNVHRRWPGRLTLGRIGLSIATMLVVLAGCIEFVDAPGSEPDEGSPPSAFLTVNEDGDNTAPAVVRFDASASWDADGSIVDYAWFLDGEPLAQSGPVIDLYLARSDSYRVGVTVTDDDGRAAATSAETTLGAAPSPFTIQVVFFDDEQMTLDQRRTFSAAARRWAEVIESDFAPTEVSLDASQCGPNPAFSGVVDDLVVFASIGYIDGDGDVHGNTVALAGPCYDPSNPTPPPFGYMQFDRDDLDVITASTSLETVVLHEMGHVLGIGTLWNVEDRTDVDIEPKVAPVPCYGEPDPRYTDVNAVREWRTISGTMTGVPVEEGLNNGTSCGHWNEYDEQEGDPPNESRPDLFDELMTGYLNPTMRLSRITVGALDDLAYEVNYEAADDYSFLSLRAQEFDRERQKPIIEELRPYAIPGLPKR